MTGNQTCKRPILIVRGEGIASPFGEDVFDLPEALVLASEGFCPYHRNEKPVPVTVASDGTVMCSKDQHRQAWTWSVEDAP